ncbi:hypothetical protein CBR_g307 [Chara braunii]|uniref:Uncharacterized protein n=1 Tax=Chara braunii TaxID=69332 RepID=A0A388JQ82_CHABU|nr:hypothetical protein CBR_g307 [Chara braunii]|eukprot:GBG59976.1 hypothetical protein CBR_g307 [Chara braunii]
MMRSYVQKRVVKRYREDFSKLPLDYAVALDEDNDEDEEGGSVGPHDDGGNESDVEVGDDNMQDRGALADEDADTPMHGYDISPAGAVGAARGQPSTSCEISLSQSRSKGGHDSHAMQGPKAKKRTRETSPSASTHKRQARTDVVNEARGALIASQEARPPRKNSQGGQSGGQGGGHRGGGRGGARKRSQRARPQELRDLGDEGEGVDPRMPEDADESVQRVVPIDTTRCFFLKYDDQGFATQDVYALRVDVMRIKRIPRGRILFNHCSLSENIVRGIENVIESSISTDPGAWDRPELVLAPVDRNDIVGGQGRRITPTEFLERDPAEFNWYAACGQHTVEAMKRLVRKDSPTVKVYGLNAYSKCGLERFFEMFNEGKLSVGDGKIPLDMPGRMKGRLLGPYTDETKGQRTLYHCVYATDGPKGSTVSWKDLCPSYFKNFGDLTCREREFALLLLMKGKAVATNVKVLPPRVNTECLLDIMRKKRYMVRMFNYVLFHAEGRADDEWNDAFFMSYKDLEDRYGPNGLCAAEWEKERDNLHVNKVKMVPRRLGGVEEARRGTGLGPTAAKYKEAPFHLKVFIYTAIDKLDLLRAEVKRIASSTRHIVWDKFGKQMTLLPVCMPSKEVLAVPDDIVAAALKMTCRAAIVNIPSSNFSTTWTSHEFDALHTLMTKCCGQNWVLFFFAPQKVHNDVLRHLFRWEDVEVIPGTWKRVDRPPNDITRYSNMATMSRDMMAIVLHAEGGDLKKVTVKPRLHNDLTTVHVVEEKFGKCQGKHGGIEGDDSAVYSILKREPGKLRSLCGSFVGEAEGVLLLGRVHAGLVWELLLAGNNVIACDESAKDIAYLTKFVDILVKDERFACHVEKPRCKHRSNRDMFHKLGRKRLKVWEYLFRDAPQGRLDGNYIYRKTKENPGQSEGTVKDKAKELFSVLRDNQQLEYSWKFYALRTSPSCGSIDWKINQTIGTMKESSSQDAVPLSASPPVPTQAGQSEDDRTTVVKIQEVHMTSMSQISVATTELSKRMDVSNALSSDAGATYGSLLLTCAALEGTSEMQPESAVGLSVSDSQLQRELCTGKGDA